MQFHTILAVSAFSLFSLYNSVDGQCNSVFGRYAKRDCKGEESVGAFISIKLKGNMIVYESNNPQCSLGRMEYYFSNVQICINLGTFGHSMWWSGYNQNYCEEFISLFRYGSFHGDRWETRASGKVNFDYNPQSLIVVGYSPWTLYENEDFTGSSFCVNSKGSSIGEPNFVTDTTALFPRNFFPKSVAKGCWY